MRKATAAEWILSLTTAPDRAASTAGDLLEEAPARGVFWFWSCVLRTASSHVWLDLCASPLRTLSRAIWGVVAIAWFYLAFGMLVSMHVRVPTYWGNAPAPWGPVMVAVVMATGAPLLVGWEVARRSAGRELADALAVAALCETLEAVNAYLSRHPWPGMGGPLREVAWAFVQALSLIAGAILFRRHTLARRKSAS